MKVRNMTEGNPIRLIFAVGLPLMLGNVFQHLYTVVDAQVVGSYVGVAALAAVGAANWFHYLFLGLVEGLTEGFAIPMAQAFGADDYLRLRRNVGNAIVLSVLSALLITLCAISSVELVLNLLSTPVEIRPMATVYLRILFGGMPIVMGYNLSAATLRALGDGRSPLYAMVIAAIINIGLDFLFVGAFHWGVVGAAVATVIAQCFSFLFCLYRLHQLPIVHPSRGDLKLRKADCSQLMRLGLPISMQNAIIAIGGMIVQGTVNPLGVSFIAGYTATNKLYGVLEMAAVSYGYAVCTYSGQNLGAGKTDRIRKGVRAAAVVGVLTAAFICVLTQIFGQPVLSTFLSGTPQEIAAAKQIGWEFLWMLSVYLPILYILHIYRSAQQGMGNTLMPMVSGVVELIMRTGAALLLPRFIGYRGVFWAEVLAWSGACCVLIPSYLHMVRKPKQQS